LPDREGLTRAVVVPCFIVQNTFCRTFSMFHEKLTLSNPIGWFEIVALLSGSVSRCVRIASWM
jgi:hypothetical protein